MACGCIIRGSGVVCPWREHSSERSILGHGGLQGRGSMNARFKITATTVFGVSGLYRLRLVYECLLKQLSLSLLTKCTKDVYCSLSVGMFGYLRVYTFWLPDKIVYGHCNRFIIFISIFFYNFVWQLKCMSILTASLVMFGVNF